MYERCGDGMGYGQADFPDGVIPCGFIKYTCEAQPRVTYINQQMIDLLRIPQAVAGEMDYLELLRSNIFLLIPVEERRRFAKYLNRVYSCDTPIAGEMTMLRCDGSRARVFGWIVKCVNAQGEAEFQSVCMDMTERVRSRKEEETQRYMRALTEVYDKVFAFHLDADTVECLHCEDTSSFKRMEGIAVRTRDALEKWLLGTVNEEEREPVRVFFQEHCRKGTAPTGARPPQITYHALSSGGDIRTYTGILLDMEDATRLFCCRAQQEEAHAQALRRENAQLREGMRDLAMRFRDGIAGFEISPENGVRPLYASANVCEFFGCSEEEWMELTGRYTPLREFVAFTEFPYEAFAEGLARGEAEFPYYDVRTGLERRIKVICSPGNPGSGTPRYAMLYDLGVADGQEAAWKGPSVFIRTFGYFDVFVDDQPIAFRNKKAKELLALLVDRRGGYVTSEEAIGYLWEDEPASSMTLSRYRKVALRLRNTLEEYGIPDILESVDGKRRIVMDRVQCDLYQYLSGRGEYVQLFKGSYLTNYSWGETTLGELMA